MREGGCLCGAVRYRVSGEPVASGICHCQTCRKASSGPTLPFVVFRADQFAITRGSATEFQSSPPVTRTFCGRCGSPLTYRTAEQPDRIDVMTCSLDDPEAIPPTFHVWATGTSPGEWVLQARITEARRLLETTGLPIEQIATATGFGSADTLRHHFRTRLYTSPARYRSSFAA